MTRRLKQVALVLVAALVAIQFIRPNRVNPPTDPARAIQAQPGISSELSAILHRACGDCHSNDTAWPWYTEIAPLSWLMALAVGEGRKTLNFSEWASYPPVQQHLLLTLSCNDVMADKMPGPYTWLRPETALSAADVDTICAAARRAEAGTPRSR